MTSGSVGWYKAWTLGEWSSLDPVPLFDLFMRNGESLGAIARAKGWWRFVNRGIHYLRRNSRTRARENIAFHYDLGNDFYGVLPALASAFCWTTALSKVGRGSS